MCGHAALIINIQAWRKLYINLYGLNCSVTLIVHNKKCSELKYDYANIRMTSYRWTYTGWQSTQTSSVQWQYATLLHSTQPCTLASYISSSDSKVHRVLSRIYILGEKMSLGSVRKCCVCKAQCLGGSGGIPPQENFEIWAFRMASILSKKWNHRIMVITHCNHLEWIRGKINLTWYTGTHVLQPGLSQLFVHPDTLGPGINN